MTSRLGRLLRDFRRQEMLRIAWRDLAGWATAERGAPRSVCAGRCLCGRFT